MAFHSIYHSCIKFNIHEIYEFTFQIKTYLTVLYTIYALKIYINIIQFNIVQFYNKKTIYFSEVFLDNSRKLLDIIKCYKTSILNQMGVR